MKLRFLAPALLLFSVPAFAIDQIPDIEAEICPASATDLQYGIHELMTAAQFEQVGDGWTVPIPDDTAGALLFGGRRSLIVRYVPYRLSSGRTELTASIRLENGRGSWRMDNDKAGKMIQGAIQQGMDAFKMAWPCQ